MPKQYDKQTILEMCDQAIQRPASFYSQDFINYRGICTDVQIPYTEIIAEYLIDHLPAFTSGIPTIHRTASYRTPTHKGKKNLVSNRTEEHIAIDLFNFSQANGCYEKIGKILDYQIPLKNTLHDSAGKVDLIAYDGNTLHLLELKKTDTSETMLRCLLEIYTYLLTVDTAKLLADFDLSPDTAIKASPFVFENSLPYQEYFDERPNLKKLIHLLDCEPLFLRKVSDRYEVFD